MNEYVICCLCGEHISDYGHCAEPVQKGRCCDKCNKEIVMPIKTEFLNAIQKGIR